MDRQVLHRAQVSILRTLRHSPDARYTMLMRPTGLDSDVFKFHLRKLMHQKYVRKLESGAYELTPSGKEFANNLSKAEPMIQKQPKLSVAVIAYREVGDKKEYLFQKRLRSPFYEFWGCISGPVQWGEPVEATAERELRKQTGLTAEFTARAFCRKSDYDSDSKILLEDKLFTIVEAANIEGELSNAWTKGLNAWMTLADLKKQEKYFSSTLEFIDMLDTNRIYKALDVFYEQDDY